MAPQNTTSTEDDELHDNHDDDLSFCFTAPSKFSLRGNQHSSGNSIVSLAFSITRANRSLSPVIYGGSQHNNLSFQKYYNLDAYYKHQVEKEKKKGIKKDIETERTVFNDEEQRRLELRHACEKQKE